MSQKQWTIKDLLTVTAVHLKKKFIESPRLTADLLLAHQLDMDRITLYLNFDKPLSEHELAGYRTLIRRRLLHEPLQYITGVREFWSIEFMVDNRALVPRPETELLVETALSLVGERFSGNGLQSCILDLGTGCGPIAVALAKELPDAKICATDISEGALELAQQNAEAQGLLDRIEFLKGDLWEPLQNSGKTFDVILSNPPYIASEEYDLLPPEIRDYEPRVALDGHKGGMYYIERIISGAANFLNPLGWLILEMDPRQTEPALAQMSGIASYGNLSRIKDYSHEYRAVIAQHLPQLS